LIINRLLTQLLSKEIFFLRMPIVTPFVSNHTYPSIYLTYLSVQTCSTLKASYSLLLLPKYFNVNTFIFNRVFTMVSYAEICASNARITPAHLPRIAVFVGGAAGIGNAALTALVSQKNPLKVYIVGQNQSSRESWLESLQQSTLDAEIVRLEGQVSLLSEVKRLCTEINNREQRVDLLWLSAGFLPLTGRHGEYLLLQDL
jgi:hypothetical protein